MSSLNKAMIIGRLGADPEVRFTQSNTAVATMNVAQMSDIMIVVERCRETDASCVLGTMTELSAYVKSR
jgi:Single-stranded DNA-binding protein